MTNILEMDAILDRQDGQLREPDWPEADVVVGNPPFLGDKKMRAELGHEYVEDLRALYKDRVPGGADLVTYWFERSRALVETGKVRRAGLVENSDIAFQGPVMVGPFDIDPTTAETFLLHPNPHGRPNSEVVLPFTNAADITGRRRGRYIVDFGQRSEVEASLYEAPFEYVKEHVKPKRELTRRENRRKYWWRHGEPGTKLRGALSGKSRKIATPLVSKHRVFVWLPINVVANQTVNIIALDDDYSFGVLHSQAHELWARGTGTQLREVESGFRYTPTTCFETFPFPEATEEQRAEISATAKRLDELRRKRLNPEGADDATRKKRTLTNLYNDRPTWLANAHAQLDAAVFAAYGWPEDPDELSEEELLRRLLELNTQRSKAPEQMT